MGFIFLPNYITMLAIFYLPGYAKALTLTECNSAGHFDIAQHQQAYLTCTGFYGYNNIYWSVTDPSGKEIRISECNSCGPPCPSCSQLVGCFNVSRDMDDSSTLQFLNPSLVTDWSTIKCSSFINHTDASCQLFVVRAKALNLTECNSAGHFDIVEHQQSYLTCTGFYLYNNIYWSITDPSGKEIRISECTSCRSTCPPCSQLADGYAVSRERNDSATLQFLNTSLITDGSTIKCSSFINHTNAICHLIVIPDYTFNLLECNAARNFDIVQHQQPSITCTGFSSGHNIYWSITDQSSQEIRVAECRNCFQGCPPCSLRGEGFTVNRSRNDSATLQFLNQSQITDGSTIKCSSFNNVRSATCQLFFVPAYTIPGCNGNAIHIKEDRKAYIRCEGLQRFQNMYWTVSYGNGTVFTIGECKECGHSVNTCPNCVTMGTDFNVTRGVNYSTLVIQNNVRQKDGATLRCSKRDNATHDDCRISVESRESSSAFPVAAVSGGAAGFVLIVFIVVVIVVVVIRRGPKRSEEMASTTNGATNTYDSLYMPDVGLPSVYSVVGPRTVMPSSSVDLYQGLEMSEVGQSSVYSQLGQDA